MDTQVQNAIVSFIWGIADDCLRDVYTRGKYRDVILPMTVIRRLDDMLEDTKPEVLKMKKMLDDAGVTNQWGPLCNADMLLKGDGEQAEHIAYGSTLSADGHATRQFDFMLANPPYGKSWSMDADKMGGKKNILDSRFNAYLADGTELAMIPRTSDGQLLFLLNNVAKMKKDTPFGSRIAEIHNGSSIFTGDAGSGESNAHRYLIENVLVEAIIALPENMFYNTGIDTFVWVLSNRKEDRRKGKIQLIDATAMKEPLRKNMGKKNCALSTKNRQEIMRLFMEMEENDVSMVFNNEEFGYWNVTVERPLRLRVFPERSIPKDTFKKRRSMN